jgi:hypothetical protein
MVRFAWSWGALGALACSAVWAVSPPVTGDVCINQGPTRECILPTPVVPLKPQMPPAQVEGNMLVNGSFEQPALSVGDWQVHQAIPGWVTVDGPGIELQHHAAGAPHHGNQLGAGALALKGQLLPGAGHPAGGHAHPGKAEMAGFLAALAHRAAAVVGIQQGVVDQGG